MTHWLNERSLCDDVTRCRLTIAHRLLQVFGSAAVGTEDREMARLGAK